MNPLKLLLLALLLYLLLRLIRGGHKKNGSLSWLNRDTIKHDILIEDPVCHVYVPKSQAVALERNGRYHYFCSKKCRDAFCSTEENRS